MIVFRVKGDSIFALGHSFGFTENADGNCVFHIWAVAHFDYIFECDTPVVETLRFVEAEDAARSEQCCGAADCEINGQAHCNNDEDAERFASMAANGLEDGGGHRDDGGEEDEDKEKVEDLHLLLSITEYFILQSTQTQARCEIALRLSYGEDACA